MLRLDFKKALALILWAACMFCYQPHAKAQCGAIDFFSPDTILCAPNSASFFIQNLPSGASVEWTFGSATLSGNTSPIRVYENPGEYTVALRVTLINNATCEIIKPQYIKAKPRPLIDIQADPKALCMGPDTVTIIDRSPNMKTRDYLLQGVLYTNVSTEFRYMFDSASGPKALYVFATDSFGCRNIQVYDTFINSYTPLDSLGWDIRYMPSDVACSPARITLERMVDSAENHVFSQFLWESSMASPASSSASRPANMVFPEGLHSIKHTVVNSDGCEYTIEKEDWIRVYDSIAPQITLSKTALCAGEEVLITATPFSGIGTLNWQFFDAPHTVVSGTDSSVLVRLNQIGPVDVQVLYQNQACRVQKTFPNAVTVTGPNPNFVVPMRQTCIVPFDFTAYNTSDTSGSNGVAFSWIVRNSTTQQTVFSSNLPDSVSFQVTDTAYYDVILYAEGNNGCSDSLLVSRAMGMDSLHPQISIDPYPTCPAQNVRIKGISDSVSYVDMRYDWWLYDLDKTTVLNQRMNDTQFVVSVPDTGRYSLFVRAHNVLGCSGGRYFYDTLPAQVPLLDLQVSNPNPCRRESVQFASGFNAEDYPGYTTRWIFRHRDSAGLQLFANGPEPELAFNVPGPYDVFFTSRSPNGQCRDTALAPFTLQVNGVLVRLNTPDDLEGCEPLAVNWNAQVLMDYNFTNSVAAQYTWKAQPNMASQTDFIPGAGLQTTAIYKPKGQHRTRVVVEHGAGCLDSFYSPNFVVGSTASFSFGSSVRCVNTVSTINNFSLNATRFLWEVDSPQYVVLGPTDTSRNPTIEVLKEGDYFLTLYSIGPEGCRDTSRRLVRVIDPTPDFVSPDTVQFCAPVVVTFTPTPVWYGNEYRWYFGDGDSLEVNTARPVSHVYNTNTDPEGITVKLVVRNPACRDTAVKEGYVKIVGPIAEYDFSINNQCEPMQVDFANTSRHYSRFFFEYGDGNIIDSTDFEQYTYTVQDKALNAQCYESRLILVDDNGCFASFDHPSPICVRKSAEPLFSASDTVGCERFTVDFTNQSLFAVNFRWDFEGDGNFVPMPTFNSQYTYNSGVFTPRLAAFNVNGCSDTTPVSLVRVWSQPKPQSRFVSASDSICYNKPLRFFSQATASVPITDHRWHFGDPASARDTSSQVNPEYSYLSPLLKWVTLVVTDSNTCKDTVTQPVFVLDTLPLPNPGFHYLTIENNSRIVMKWPQSNEPSFLRYTTYWDETGYTPLYETFQRADTQYTVTTGINVDDRRYCYAMRKQDTCQILSRYSKPHCTVTLEAEKAGPSRLMLNWLHYVGWELDQLWGYIIYRSDAGGPYLPIDTVNNTTDFYLDLNLCEIPYCYYVEAVHQNRVFRSVSNVACETPDYVYPTETPVMRLATVEDNRFVRVLWEPYTAMNNLSHFAVHRFNHATQQQDMNYDTSQSLQYRDMKTQVGVNAYTYKVSAVDLCGYEAPESGPAKTIHLSTQMSGYRAQLNWNSYQFWPDGIEEYGVEYGLASQELMRVGSAQNIDSSFVFEDINVDDNEKVCFRVYGVRNNRVDTSYSNVSCRIPESRIYLPSAFSPNQDGLNDVFKVSAIYIHGDLMDGLYGFEMKIFDRWGSQLFVSQDKDLGWDGTYHGKIVPNGVYLYKVQAVGLDGKVYDFKGTVHLIR